MSENQAILVSCLLVLPLLAVAYESSSSSSSSLYSDCAPVPYSCGDLHFDLSYPFMADMRHDYCGHPGYYVNCSNNVLSIGNNPYQVTKVDSLNHLLQIVDTNFVGQSCPAPYTSTNLNSSLFEYSERNRNLTLYVNCSSSSPFIMIYDISCLFDIMGRHSYYRLDNGSFPEPLGRCSSTVVIPITQEAAGSFVNGSSFGAALQQGFFVKWKAGRGWCRGCVDSGGYCGYRSAAPDEQTCYCPDGTAIGNCGGDKRKSKVIIIGVIGSLAFVIFIFSFCTILKRKKNKRGKLSCTILKRKKNKRGVVNIRDHLEAKGKKSELPLYKLSAISTATKNFSPDNKLGEGGFGPVYKGMLFDVQVAVKRLSRSSAQGLEEFKSEIQVLAKLQHTNLVKILGCCIEAEEKIVVYEYMKNGSLDKHLFNPHKGAMLDWHKRVHIIEGIMQGLLYLHKYSRLRVIHRDLKASNILLDADINPKISDFGMARIFNPDKSQVNTNRVVGTYGYMSPEYAMEGLFSVKSDVFSFGVLLLEILSGKRNHGHHNHGSPQNLLGYAWELLIQGKEVELMDTSLGEACPSHDISRYVKVALLCVQELAVDRPTMADVSDMLNNQSMTLPTPKQPAFFVGRFLPSRDANLEMQLHCSNNCISLSLIDGR